MTAGSPSHGQLQRGDVIQKINGKSTALMSHQKACDTIKNAGSAICLQINRWSFATYSTLSRSNNPFRPVLNCPPSRPVELFIFEIQYLARFRFRSEVWFGFVKFDRLWLRLIDGLVAYEALVTSLRKLVRLGRSVPIWASSGRVEILLTEGSVTFSTILNQLGWLINYLQSSCKCFHEMSSDLAVSSDLGFFRWGRNPT